MTNANGTLTLIGSGEFGDGMARVYRAILTRAPSTPNLAVLDTPAGFELNADAIAAKAVDYFSQRFDLTPKIASHKNKTRANAVGIESALNLLRRADIIFAGPGSPGYTVRNLHETPIWETAVNRFEHGAHLVFASAAAIAAGASALPVYEIYKAGDDLHWLRGLNLFASLDMQLAIIPHWNNAEGGTYDTRYCYMGESRFLELETMLPPATVVLGIDEYTACLFDVAAQECRVMGAGSVTIRRAGISQNFLSGSSFPFARLRTDTHTVPFPAAASAPSASNASDETTLYLMQLARALDETRESNLKRDLITRAHDTMHELSADWMDPSHIGNQDDISPYVETFIEIRKQLRRAKQYALADEIRQRLATLQIVLEDSAAGTTWHKAETAPSSNT